MCRNTILKIKYASKSDDKIILYLNFQHEPLEISLEKNTIFQRLQCWKTIFNYFYLLKNELNFLLKFVFMYRMN